MRICFLGNSFAAQHLSAAAAEKGFELCGLNGDPALVFVSEDTPTNEHGVRDLEPIRDLFWSALRANAIRPGEVAPVILTSQVPPGFMRELGGRVIFHQAETLRIKDAAFRASHPEMFIVGCANPAEPLPKVYETYLNSFNCPILTMSYESAEFSKIAINAFLISQVETTNMLSRLAERCGAKWTDVQKALWNDSRIGPNAYLEPGTWMNSRHLLRDYVTLREIAPFHGGEALLRAWDGFQYT